MVGYKKREAWVRGKMTLKKKNHSHININAQGILVENGKVSIAWQRGWMANGLRGAVDDTRVGERLMMRREKREAWHAKSIGEALTCRHAAHIT